MRRFWGQGREEKILEFFLSYLIVCFVKTNKEIFLIIGVLVKDEKNLKNFKNQINDKIL